MSEEIRVYVDGIHIWGEGKSFNQAVSNLAMSLEDVYFQLKKERLGKGLQSQYKFLEDLFKNQYFLCDCKNIDIGSHDNTIMMPYPKELEEVKNNRIKAGLSDKLCFDKCMYNELRFLWNRKIQTIECCCGHKKLKGYVAVKEKYCKEMLQLGYKPDDRTSAKAVFYCKTQ